MRTGTLFLKFFFFNDTATTEIYTLSLHDALPISFSFIVTGTPQVVGGSGERMFCTDQTGVIHRSEEHTSELQSRLQLVCRLLLGKKKNAIPCCRQMTSTTPRLDMHYHHRPSRPRA